MPVILLPAVIFFPVIFCADAEIDIEAILGATNIIEINTVTPIRVLNLKVSIRFKYSLLVLCNNTYRILKLIRVPLKMI